LTFAIGGYTYTSPTNVVKNPLYPAFDTLPATINVAAQGTWLGDIANPTTPSTIARMSISPDNQWLSNSLSFGLNPTLNPNWVTNLTGNATTDDDIITAFSNNTLYNNTATYTAATDLNNFVGTSNLPASFKTLTGISTSGGGG